MDSRTVVVPSFTQMAPPNDPVVEELFCAVFNVNEQFWSMVIVPPLL